MLNKEAKKALIRWKPASDQIIPVWFQLQHTRTTAVQVYVPTEDVDEVEKDAFYNHLQDIIDEIHSHDIKVLIGDMNTQIDNNRQGLEHMIRPYRTS